MIKKNLVHQIRHCFSSQFMTLMLKCSQAKAIHKMQAQISLNQNSSNLDFLLMYCLTIMV